MEDRSTFIFIVFGSFLFKLGLCPQTKRSGLAVGLWRMMGECLETTGVSEAGFIVPGDFNKGHLRETL